MLRTVLVLAVCALLCTLAFAQSVPRRNALSFDVAGGLTLGVGVNYHRVLFPVNGPGGAEIGFASAHLGAGLNALHGSFALPHGFSFNLGRQGNYFEVGYTASYATHSDYRWRSDTGCGCAIITPERRYYGMPLLGYRRQAPRGFLFRLHAAPYLNGSEVFPWGGVSVGKSF